MALPLRLLPNFLEASIVPTLQKFGKVSPWGSPRGTRLNCVVSGDVCELFNNGDRMCVKAAAV